MADLSWLSSEAKTIHALFTDVFFSLATVLLLLGVILEYFKLPLGGLPQASQLVGRVLVAALLLATYAEVSNAIAEFTDALAKQLGDLNEFHHVLDRMGDKLGELSWSWTSIKESVMLLISFVTFFVLYISVYLADAGIVYAWALLYVFSPLLIALYILPQTAGATRVLYRSLLEVSAWKIVWSVLATLLWSAALSQINQPGANVNFITAIAFNLILAASLLLTPLVVNALTSKGIGSLANTMTGMAAGAAFLSPGQMAQAARKGMKERAGTLVASGVQQLKSRYFSKNDDPGNGGGKTGRIPPGSRPTQAKPSRGSPGQTLRPSSSSERVSYSQAVTEFQPPANRGQVSSTRTPASKPVVQTGPTSHPKRRS